MEAQKMGAFVAQRRKELGMTQAALAQKLGVTDKAVSRWERGVGLPDIGSIELLAQTVDVSLIELVQAQRSERANISIKEAESLLADTIALSKTGIIPRIVGGGILMGFAAVTVLLIWVLVSSMHTLGKTNTVLYSVGSIIAGLVAWAIHVWQMTFARKDRRGIWAVASFAFAMSAVTIQFFGIANDVFTGDWAAIEDTIKALYMVVVLFGGITVLLNGVMVFDKTGRKRMQR